MSPFLRRMRLRAAVSKILRDPNRSKAARTARGEALSQPVTVEAEHDFWAKRARDYCDEHRMLPRVVYGAMPEHVLAGDLHEALNRLGVESDGRIMAERMKRHREMVARLDAEYFNTPRNSD